MKLKPITWRLQPNPNPKEYKSFYIAYSNGQKIIKLWWKKEKPRYCIIMDEYYSDLGYDIKTLNEAKKALEALFSMVVNSKLDSVIGFFDHE